jgi:hypothetical protein
MANLARELVNAEQRYADLKLKTQLFLYYIDNLTTPGEWLGHDRQRERLESESKALAALIAKHEAAS